MVCLTCMINGEMICVNDLWKFIFIFFLLIQMGCSNQIYEPPSDKYPFEVKMIDFSEIILEL